MFSVKGGLNRNLGVWILKKSEPTDLFSPLHISAGGDAPHNYLNTASVTDGGQLALWLRRSQARRENVWREALKHNFNPFAPLRLA